MTNTSTRVNVARSVGLAFALTASVLGISTSTASAASTGGKCEGKQATENTRIEERANITIYHGSSGNDVIVATTRTHTPGPVVVYGGNGADTICIVGHEGTVFGGNGSDTIIGGPYFDVLVGGGHHDIIKGNGSTDLIFGGWGNDKLYGGWGNDDIDGGPGTDRAWGYRGTDTCTVEIASRCER